MKNINVNGHRSMSKDGLKSSIAPRASSFTVVLALHVIGFFTFLFLGSLFSPDSVFDSLNTDHTRNWTESNDGITYDQNTCRQLDLVQRDSYPGPTAFVVVLSFPRPVTHLFSSLVRAWSASPSSSIAHSHRHSPSLFCDKASQMIVMVGKSAGPADNTQKTRTE